MKTLITLLLLSATIVSSAQDGSDIWYVRVQALDTSYLQEFAHLDFYRRSFRGSALDTVRISVNGKPVKFVERRKDNGFNNWFIEQYLESLEMVDKVKLRIEKCQLKEIRADSILVVNYFTCYDTHNKRLDDRAFQQQCWFKKHIITEILIQREQGKAKKHMQADKLSSDWLFRRHPEQTVKGWLRQLRYFYFVRAWGGHANDADAFEVGFLFNDRQDMMHKLAQLGFTTDKPGRSILFGYSAYVSVFGSTIKITVADTKRDTPYEVSDYDFQVCLALEKEFDKLGWQPIIDRKIEESICCISRTKYPELYDKP